MPNFVYVITKRHLFRKTLVCYFRNKACANEYVSKHKGCKVEVVMNSLDDRGNLYVNINC